MKLRHYDIYSVPRELQTNPFASKDIATTGRGLLVTEGNSFVGIYDNLLSGLESYRLLSDTNSTFISKAYTTESDYLMVEVINYPGIIPWYEYLMLLDTDMYKATELAKPYLSSVELEIYEVSPLTLAKLDRYYRVPEIFIRDEFVPITEDGTYLPVSYYYVLNPLFISKREFTTYNFGNVEGIGKREVILNKCKLNVNNKPHSWR